MTLFSGCCASSVNSEMAGKSHPFKVLGKNHGIPECRFSKRYCSVFRHGLSAAGPAGSRRSTNNTWAPCGKNHAMPWPSHLFVSYFPYEYHCVILSSGDRASTTIRRDIYQPEVFPPPQKQTPLKNPQTQMDEIVIASSCTA